MIAFLFCPDFFEQKTEDNYDGPGESMEVSHFYGNIYRIGDYVYMKDKTTAKGVSYFRCHVHKRFPDCKGRAIITEKLDGSSVVKVKNSHSHDPVDPLLPNVQQKPQNVPATVVLKSEPSLKEKHRNRRKKKEDITHSAIVKKEDIAHSAIVENEDIAHSAIVEKEDIAHSAIVKKEDIAHSAIVEKEDITHSALVQKEDIAHSAIVKKEDIAHSAIVKKEDIAHSAIVEQEDIAHSPQQKDTDATIYT